MFCFLPFLGEAVTAETGFQLEGLLAANNGMAPRQTSASQHAAAETARKNGVLVEWNLVLGIPQRLRGTNLLGALSPSAGKQLTAGGQFYEERALSALNYLRPLYNDNTNSWDFRPRKAERDRLGYHHVRLGQFYGGLRVAGSELIVHFDPAGRVYEVNGEAVSDPGVELSPVISPDGAAESAIGQLTRQYTGSLQLEAWPELVVFALRSPPRLAYEVALAASSGEMLSPFRWKAWVDAADGTLILAYNDIKFIAPPSGDGAPAQIKGNVLPSEGGEAISITGWLESNGVYYLHNTNWFWQVYNLGTAGPDAATYAFRFNESWDLSDPVEISAARNFDFAQRYFWGMHGLRSFDNSGIFAQANVHYSQDYANAFWSGAAFYFGDGNGTTAGPMVSLDIAAHEYTHAVTDYSARLIYADESGALNESFSDIFGVSVEFFAQADDRAEYPARTAGTADWLMGEDCWLAAPALRDLRNPHNSATVGSQRQPSRYQGDYWYAGVGDNGGVHRNSGVQNFFFYLLSEGGSGTNNGIVYNVAGIGITNAAQVAYRALTVYCTPGTDYQAARGAWVSASLDLDSNWVASVADAWSAVGIGSMRASPGAIVFRGPPGGPFTSLTPEVTLFNWGVEPLNWGIVSTQAWLQATPSAGSIGPVGSTLVSLSTTPAAASLPAALYTNDIIFTNQLDPSGLVSQIRLYIGQPDHYTELFDNNDLDLAFSSLTFVPNGGPSFYSVCRDAVTQFPTDPAAGVSVPLGDDAFVQMTLGGTNTVGIYGQKTNACFIGSNGYITFGSGDNVNLPMLANHFARPRIAALLNDLNPAEGGNVSWLELSNRVVVTFQDVPVFGNPSLKNSFQIEMFYDGAIRISYLNLAFQNGLAGLSQGTGVPPAFSESHFSSYSSCHLPLLLRCPAQVTEGDNVLIAGASLSIPFPATTNVFIRLSSSDPTEIWIQPTALLLAGRTNVDFDLTVLDDSRIDGTTTVILTAKAEGYEDGVAAIPVLDNESVNLALALPATASELAGVLSNAAIVEISGTLPTNLVVDLASGNPAALEVPSQVIIPAGEISRSFDLTIIDNAIATGGNSVSLTVSADGFTAGSNSVVILDDETPPVPREPSPADAMVAVARTNDLSWQNGAMAGQVITNFIYLGTNSSPGPDDLLGFTTNSTWTLPLLSPQTTYYWQVVAHNVGETPGPVWHFTTRGVDHFEWAPIPSPQYVGLPVNVTLFAKDELEGVFSNFTGTVSLRGSADGLTNNWGGGEISPTNCGAFASGAWTGTLLLAQTGTNVVLSAADTDGRVGSSNPFNVLVPNDVEIRKNDHPDRIFLGGLLTNIVEVFNTGPSNASAVEISYSLSPSLQFVTAESSQGLASYTNDTVVAGIGLLPSGEVATLTVVTRPTRSGTLTNSILVTRGEPDGQQGNNFAKTFTEVVAPLVTVSNLTVLEGNATANLQLSFQLSVASPHPVSVDFATADGDASAGSDYAATNGTITFAPGETNRNLPITILGDTIVETNEVFHLLLANVTNAILTASNLAVIILNDDFPPPPPQTVLMSVFDPANRRLWLSLTNLLGPYLEATNVSLYRSTNLAAPDWELLTNEWVLTNGVLRTTPLDVRDSPVQYFRAGYYLP